MTRNEIRRKRFYQKRLFAILTIITLVFLLVSISLHAQDSGDEKTQGQKEEKTSDEEVFVINSGEYVEKKTDAGMELNLNVEKFTPITDEIPLDYTTQEKVIHWCEEYRVPYSMALAVIEAESSFRPDAKNGNCYGYMQINSINRSWLNREIGVTDLSDPLQNIHSGIYMLGDLYEKYGDWDKVLMCYNCGEAGAYNHYFSQGITSSVYSRHVLDLEAKWGEVIPQ